MACAIETVVMLVVANRWYLLKEAVEPGINFPNANANEKRLPASLPLSQTEVESIDNSNYHPTIFPFDGRWIITYNLWEKMAANTLFVAILS